MGQDLPNFPADYIITTQVGIMYSYQDFFGVSIGNIAHILQHIYPSLAIFI